jgi:hypothetical protein
LRSTNPGSHKKAAAPTSKHTSAQRYSPKPYLRKDEHAVASRLELAQQHVQLLQLAAVVLQQTPVGEEQLLAHQRSTQAAALAEKRLKAFEWQTARDSASVQGV